MLRQLARLTQPLPAAGPEALAVAVYADAIDRHVAARESGFEGVACIDDAARALDVMCDVWARTRAAWAERWARGLLDWVLWMQEPDGRWLNFIYDWEGTRNTSGLTSGIGENFWHARALCAVTHAWLTFGDARAEAAMHLGMDHALMKPAPSDVRVLHMITACRLIEAGGHHPLRAALRHWAHDIAACHIDGALMNSPDERGTPHLWAHVQEGVLAQTSQVLDDPTLLQIAERSAEAVIVPAIVSGFDRPATMPFDVTSCVYSADRLFETTHDERWRVLASDARAWFDGRNAAGRPVYDRERGRIADGIDHDRASGNSGAESNIVGAEALMDDAVAVAEAHGDEIAAILWPDGP